MPFKSDQFLKVFAEYIRVAGPPQAAGAREVN